MPAPADAPAWASDLVLGYESGAYSQFLLTGNVADRLLAALAPGKPPALVGLVDYLQSILLPSFTVIFTYDPGNGLRIARGAEVFAQWGPGKSLPRLPSDARAAIELVTRYLLYQTNLAALGQASTTSVACIVRGADLVLPAGPGQGPEVAALASLVRDWASEGIYTDRPFASILIADNLNDLHPLVAMNPRTLRLSVPMPAQPALGMALELARVQHPAAMQAVPPAEIGATAAMLCGVTQNALDALLKQRAHAKQPLSRADLAAIKKAMVERDCNGLIEFIESKRTLDDLHGQPALKDWLRQDLKLWAAGDTQALPMGYLLCGPVGTGKTYMVECLAGEAGVPVVKLKNFRDKWVGSSEGNLEKIFRLVHALGRCFVFVDEADQALGKRDSGANDAGLSGRIYAMIAEEMSKGENRGKIVWLLASSRPDLIEVDLKRPGRVDVKIPLLPTTTAAESFGLLRALCKRRGLLFEDAALTQLEAKLPLLLTPGAAEAIAVKAYRISRTQKLDAVAALVDCLEGYQPPVPPAVLEHQMRLAVREATDLDFVPPALRHLAERA